MDDNAYRASVWVRENAQNFNGLVFGSILLEVSYIPNKCVLYSSYHVGYRPIFYKLK
jgi:hypothetical protein